MAKEAQRAKWAIVCPTTRRYASDDRGGLAWTYERDVADEWARSLGMVVVDAVKFHADHRAWVKGERATSPFADMAPGCTGLEPAPEPK